MQMLWLGEKKVNSYIIMSGSANNTPFILHEEGFAFNVIKVGFGSGLIIVAINLSLMKVISCRCLNVIQ